MQTLSFQGRPFQSTSWTSGVYLGVVPITRDQHGLAVAGSGEVVEWAVQMCRLPDEATRSMLRRYPAERKLGRFKVYSGDHRQGTVKAVE